MYSNYHARIFIFTVIFITWILSCIIFCVFCLKNNQNTHFTMKEYTGKFFINKNGKGNKGSKLEKITFTYYTEDEAKTIGISYYKRPFPTRMKKGDHILTDDKFVVPIIKHYYNSYNGKWQVRLPHGIFNTTNNPDKDKVLSTEPTDRAPGEICKRFNVKRVFRYKLFANLLVISNFNIEYAFKTAFGREFSTNYDRRLFVALLHSNDFLEFIMDKMEALFAKAGVKPESIIERVDRTLETLTAKVEATESAQDAIALSKEIVDVANVMGDWAGFEKVESGGMMPGIQQMLLSRQPKQLTVKNNGDNSEDESIFDKDVKYAE